MDTAIFLVICIIGVAFSVWQSETKPRRDKKRAERQAAIEEMCKYYGW